MFFLRKVANCYFYLLTVANEFNQKVKTRVHEMLNLLVSKNPYFQHSTFLYFIRPKKQNQQQIFVKSKFFSDEKGLAYIITIIHIFLY